MMADGQVARRSTCVQVARASGVAAPDHTMGSPSRLTAWRGIPSKPPPALTDMTGCPTRGPNFPTRDDLADWSVRSAGRAMMTRRARPERTRGTSRGRDELWDSGPPPGPARRTNYFAFSTLRQAVVSRSRHRNRSHSNPTDRQARRTPSRAPRAAWPATRIDESAPAG